MRHRHNDVHFPPFNPKESGMIPKITALLIMTRQRRGGLLGALEACSIDVLTAGDCNEANQILQGRNLVQVVLTDARLADGDWRNVLANVEQCRPNAEVIVCARRQEVKRLGTEVFESGAYDLLVEPYEEEEVRRILAAAAAKSYMHSLPPSRAVSPKTKATRTAGAA